MSPTVYLVTGAARGIGFALVQQLSARPDTIVFAGVRNLPLAADSQLQALSDKLPGNVIPVKINSADEADNFAAAEFVKSKVGKVDVLIANAGVASGLTPFSEIDQATMLNDFTINAVGPSILLKAFAPLLQAASGTAKFIAVSSLAGRINDAFPLPFNSYGASKAALNYLLKKMDIEYPDIISFPIHPGVVSSDMGATAAVELKAFADNLPPSITPDESAASMLLIIDKAEKSSHGGKLWNYDGQLEAF